MQSFCKRVKHKPIDENESSAHYQGLTGRIDCLESQGKVGLVPTMGALHAGHASLVKRSVSENGVTVVSVFVNPTQFNDKNDLEKYPRTLDADCRLLEECGADFALLLR